MTMTARTLAISLGVALAVSVAVNLFAATAAYTALAGQDRIERRVDDRGRDDRHGSSREMISALSPQVQTRVRQALHETGMAARPDFQEAREARRQAVAAAGAEPFDAARVDALLDRSRAAELRGRERLEADTLAILASLEPADRAVFAQMLNRGRGGGGGRDERKRETPKL